MVEGKLKASYPGVVMSTTIGEPVADMIRTLAAINNYTISQTLCILIRMGLEHLHEMEGIWCDGTD